MPQSRARYLMDQLLSNTLSKDEFDELLGSMGQEQMAKDYSDILEEYFHDLLDQQNSELNDRPPDRK
jgi:transmembrane sensor